MTAYFLLWCALKTGRHFSSAVPYLLDSLNYFNQEQIEDYIVNFMKLRHYMLNTTAKRHFLLHT
ncbi:hypothetical protein ACEQPO_06435 [Bacillus sp. SL00103]